jgi:hypothetical protein
VQRDITYNHIAILPPGAGRQGDSVALRLDAADNQIPDEPKTTMKIKLTLDGKEHEVEDGSAEHLQLQARVDAEKDAELARLRGVEASSKTTAEQAAKDKARLDALEAAEKQRARTELEGKARKVLGAEAKFDGKTDRQVRELVMTKLDASVKFEGKGDDYVSVYVDARLDAAPAPKTVGTKQADAVTQIVNGTRQDSAKREPLTVENANVHVATEQARQDSREAWRKPLLISRS